MIATALQRIPVIRTEHVTYTFVAVADGITYTARADGVVVVRGWVGTHDRKKAELVAKAAGSLAYSQRVLG